jgi:hypothetical protein
MRKTKMEILKFEGSSRAPLKQRKGFRVILGITVMGVFAALGSTLAANITINSSQAVEFGQGLSAAAACDSDIRVKPLASFDNGSDTSGVFMLSGITFEDVDTSTAACAGKQFVISTYDSATETANYLGDSTNLSDSYSAVIVNIGTTFNVDSMTTTDSPTITTIAGGFRLTFDNPLTRAGNVYKVTVESRDPVN